MARGKAAPSLALASAAPARRNRVNFFELAYQRLEAFLVDCTLPPGRNITVQELQRMTCFGRTPVHAAVSRLAADTLILVRPRHGLQIAPIDLARERLLLGLRRDIERFVIRLAAERASLSYRNQALYIERALRERRDTLSVDEFNKHDLRINALILEAAGEPFVAHALRPLHTIYRRIGYIFYRHFPGRIDLADSIDCHLAILNAVANRHVDRAAAASDALINLLDQMFAEMEAGVDPGLLDCTVELLPIG
jgi:DNA-binding GntR family transcriptional regulator